MDPSSGPAPLPLRQTLQQTFRYLTQLRGTILTDALDGNVGSSVDTGGGSDKDRITVGTVTGQADAALNIPVNTTFAIRFKVKVK